jgi:hypothetical protein
MAGDGVALRMDGDRIRPRRGGLVVAARAGEGRGGRGLGPITSSLPILEPL